MRNARRSKNFYRIVRKGRSTKRKKTIQPATLPRVVLSKQATIAKSEVDDLSRINGAPRGENDRGKEAEKAKPITRNQSHFIKTEKGE